MIPNQCIELVKEFEDFRKKAYQCSAGKWTIGYGTTRYWDGQKVKQGDTITELKALSELTHYLESCVKFILDSCIDKDGKSVHFNDNQLSALGSFVYNEGFTNFASSTMLIYLQLKNFERAADEFPKWKYFTNPKTGKKEESAGLIRRRKAERDLFIKSID